MEGERIACGAAHADNVGPSLMVVRGNCPPWAAWYPPKTPKDQKATTVTHIEVNNEGCSRNILKRDFENTTQMEM
jgi:homoserine kinase